jgi:multidrug efflux system outer membrane protein
MRTLLLTSAVLCLAGCSVGPDYTPPAQSFLDRWFSGHAEKTSQEPVDTAWWLTFKDPLLEKYIEQAAKNNKDLKIALANLRSARALRREQGGAFWPEIGGTAEASRSKSSDAASSSVSAGQIRNSYDAQFDASWELDIFGGNRRSYEAAEARVGKSLAAYQDVMLSTLSEVARNYYEARSLQKRIVITQKHTQLLKESFEVINDRLEAGETSDFDLYRAQGEYQLTHALIPNLNAELKTIIYTLSVLLGLPPEALLSEMETVKPLPTPPDIVPVGLRSETLRRRPDIRVAERELSASVADIGAETAALFPQFFLTGDIGMQARLFSDIFSGGAGLWSIASMMQWSVFEGGALRARIDVQKEESLAALASYEKAVLEALRDAETSLMSYGQELETRRRLANGVESRRRSVALAKDLFNAGEQDYLAVVDAERQLIASEDDLIVSEARSVTKLIALYTALGGGWDIFE